MVMAVDETKRDISPFSRPGPRPLDPSLTLRTCQHLHKTPRVQLHRQLLMGIRHLKALDALLPLHRYPVLELNAATHLSLCSLVSLTQAPVTVDLRPQRLLIDP